MDEFLSVLLSFPLEPTPSILEIISDSVYSNSSTLDGRRFATEFSARRKLDVNARYPGLLKKGVKGSMAEVIRMGVPAKTAEWNVKVAGGRRKK